MDLQTPIGKASRTYKMYQKRLEKLGIYKLEDFLFHVPFRYDDYSLISKIKDVQAGETVTIRGKLEKIDNRYTKKRKTLQRAKVTDETGIIDVLWFNQTFLTGIMKQGDQISLSGKVTTEGNKLIMVSPQYEVIFNDETIHTGRLVPVYPETRGVSSKWLRRQIFKLLQDKDKLDEYLPEKIITENNLMDLSQAIEKVHFPKNLEDAMKAKERLAFDELFKLQLAALIRKKSWEKETVKKPFIVDEKKVNKLISSLPFELTGSQKNALEEILKDLSSQKPMNRLLEGDVGSGKTVVATVAMYVAFLNGFQSAFMAPTEILANQHYKTISGFLLPYGIRVGLFTSGQKTKKIPESFDIAIGTHALIYDKVRFDKLGFVVIDEQQRFGVEQRTMIKQKGENAHLLTMTATPIPRTVALTMYGDLDLSILSQMPKGRKLVKTWLVPPHKRNGAYGWIGEKIKTDGDQVFIVCPFIEESETMVTVKAATKEFERLKNEVFPNLRLGLLHGKLKSEEKGKILELFRKGKIDILVSTPVVEVGIDIPNATIMMVEESERFGLSQLHQLRGRVGRGDKQSYCLLFTSSRNPTTIERLKALETIYSGAELSEVDLQLRGPGQVYGTLQHGIPQLKVASFSDFKLIEKTKKEAIDVFGELAKYPKIMEQMKDINSSQVSPD